MRFADANIFIRALIGDDPIRKAACDDLFHKIDRGEVEIVTCEAVITEIVYVLSSRSRYGLSHTEIRGRLSPLIRMRGLRLPGKQIYLEALDIYASRPAIDFEDAVCVAHMRQMGIDEILSYDKDFDRMPNIHRVEP